MNPFEGLKPEPDSDCLKAPIIPDNTPQMIFDEWHEGLVLVRKQDIRLGVELTPLSLDATIAVLEWVIKAAVVLGESEHARDILLRARREVEGR